MFFKNLKIGQKMFVGFGIIILLVILVLTNSYINYTKERKVVDENIHTYNVIKETDAILISLISMETGARGFAITGDSEFLEPFTKGKLDYEEHYDRIKDLTSSNYGHQKRLLDLEKNYQTWLEWETTNIIDNRRKILNGQMEMDELIALAQTGKAKREMDSIRKILGEISKEEKAVLEMRSKELEKAYNETRMIMFIGGILALIFTIVVSLLIIRIIVFPVKAVTNTFKEISEGDVDLEARLNINSNDELGTMAKYFNKFMDKLKELILENTNQSWLKIGQAEFNEKIRGEESISELSSAALDHIVKYVDGKIGTLYIKTEDNSFKLFASYAHSRRKNLSNDIEIGDGIVGQSALEKKTIVLSNIPEDYIKISSGIGESLPRNIVVTPCLYNNNVECIIEIGSFNEFTDLQLKFIEQISSTIAISIHSVRAKNKMLDLLNKTLEQSEELQAQQEELRQSNEELEEQAEALKESESRLQSQQEELRVINEELEERTKYLEIQKNNIIKKNEELKKTKYEVEEKANALESANKYKSEFLANMSHELRTPLNSILVLSQMLANKKDNEPLTDKQLEFAKTINSSGKDLLKLINDILDLSKVEAGKMDINLESFSLYELVEYLRKSFEPIASQKGLYFNVKFENNVSENIVSDIQRVQQILNNLLSNAFKFTHNGGVSMVISQAEKTDDLEGDSERLVRISVTDTGIGIPLEKQDIVFESFKQSDGTTSRKYGGTGLGLSISKQLSHLLGGTIYLESIEGKGSTFTLVLPDKEDNIDLTEELNNENNISVDAEIETELILSKNTDSNDKILLIVEDDEKFSNILSELASEKNYKCLISKTGEKAVQLAIKHEPDAILLDIGLPDVSGWKVIEKLKEYNNTKNIPIHVISGIEDDLINKNMDNLIEYLKKPIDLDQLDKLFKDLESDTSKPLKKLLILDKNKGEIRNISNVLINRGIDITSLDNGKEAYDLLKTEKFDCMILDLDLDEMSGLELLSKLRKSNMANLPILINTEKKITQEDECELKKYSENIIIKGIRSVERLVDEASLFLHDVDSKLKEEKIQDIKFAHEKESSLKDKQILVVDDDMRNVFTLSSVLEEKGVKVIVGRDGEEGIVKLNQNADIDLVLMDMMMPKMDGYTAIKEIRKEEKFRKIPIIAITAKAMKDDREKCIEAGASDYLTKPIDTNKLISLLRVWLYR